MTTLLDKFTATVPGHGYVKYLTAERKDEFDYSVTWFYDIAHPDFDESGMTGNDKLTLTTSANGVEGWLRSGEWVIQPAKAPDFTVVTGTGNQYDLVLREDGDYDMHGAGSQSWIRTASDANRFIESGLWKVVEGPAKHSTITIDGRVYEAPVERGGELLEAFAAYGRALEALEQYRKP